MESAQSSLTWMHQCLRPRLMVELPRGSKRRSSRGMSNCILLCLPAFLAAANPQPGLHLTVPRQNEVALVFLALRMLDRRGPESQKVPCLVCDLCWGSFGRINPCSFMADPKGCPRTHAALKGACHDPSSACQDEASPCRTKGTHA